MNAPNHPRSAIAPNAVSPVVSRGPLISFGRCLRPALPMNRAGARLGLAVGIAIALAGCGGHQEPAQPAEYGILRMRLYQQCLEGLPQGPRATHDDDWNKVIKNCASSAYYVANTCDDPKACLADLERRYPAAIAGGAL